MKTISAPFTFIGKWLLPWSWLAFWAVILVVGIVRFLPEAVIGSAIMLLFGYFVAGRLSWGLADEVLDCGNHLRVRRGSTWDDIPLSRIAEVTCLPGRQIASPRVYLQLRSPSAFGTLIRFIPRVDFLGSLLAWREVADELRQRIADEHQKRLDKFREAARLASSDDRAGIPQ